MAKPPVSRTTPGAAPRRAPRSIRRSLPPAAARFGQLLRQLEGQSPALPRGAEEPRPGLPKGRVHRAEREPKVLEARERLRPRVIERDPEPAGLEPFRAVPVLQPIADPAQVAPGSGLERAQSAAMAERLLHSVRVGQVAGGHEVRLQLAGSRLEVRLRQIDGQLTPELHLPDDATGGDVADADALAARLDTELRASGLDFESIAILR